MSDFARLFGSLLEAANNAPSKEIEIDFELYEKYQNNPKCAVCPYMENYMSNETVKTKDNLLMMKEKCKKCVEKENEKNEFE